jgi:16S rRNA processing protein RimM
MPRAKRKKVAVGAINGVWGVRGHVKVTLLTSNPDRFKPGVTLLLQGIPRKVLDVQYPRGYPVVLFRGFESREAADSLIGELIEIPESELPELPEGEYYTHDLVGMAVETNEGEPLGTLVEVLRTGSNDVYVVRREGTKDVLVPAIADAIASVDVPGRRMVVVPLPGLLE